MAKGKFIVIEGCDGCGKTTVADAVEKELVACGYPLLRTREPGGIDIAEQIRNVILDPKNTAMDEKTEALLYAASRRQHLKEKVIPALENGINVLSERYVYSSLVYQGYARGIGIDEVLKINEFAIGEYFPDFTIYLDVHPDLGLERLKNRKSLDRLDQEELSFHQKVYEGYKIVNERYKDNIYVVDANRDINEVVEDVIKYCKTII